MWQDQFLQAIKLSYERKKQKNPRYSYRALARAMGLSISTVSELMRGTFSISAERAAQVVPKLGLDMRERNQLLSLMGITEPVVRERVHGEDFQFFTDWRNLAVLFFFDLDQPMTFDFIAERLGIPVSRVQRIVENLVNRGLLTKNGIKYSRSSKHFMSGDGPSSEMILRSHRDGLELCKLALDTIPAPERDFTSMVFAGSPADLPLVREEIRLFYSKVMAIMGNPPKNEVFRLSITLFPLNLSRR